MFFSSKIKLIKLLRREEEEKLVNIFVAIANIDDVFFSFVWWYTSL